MTSADDTTTYSSPGLEALLSRQFIEDHCFHLVSSSDRGEVGVAFEPTSARRRIPEIRGTLWLDRASAHLRRMDFQYVNVPEHQRERAGGEMRFTRMKDGTWAIVRWHIQMPLVALTPRYFGDKNPHVIAFKRAGGELAVAVRGTDTLWSRPPLALAGLLVDSATGVPVRAGRVALDGTRLEAVADSSSGRFIIPNVLPGEYVLSARTPGLDSLGAVHRQPVVFADSDMVLTVRVPSARQLVAALCADQDLLPVEREWGVVTGRVDVRGDAVAPANVAVIVRNTNIWSGPLDAAPGAILRPRERASAAVAGIWLEARTDATGTYRLCGVPMNVPLGIRAQTESLAAPANYFTITPAARLVQADLTLERPVAPGATLFGFVTDPERQPLQGVDVAIPDLWMSALSDERGGFRLLGLPPGDHALVARRAGNVSERLTITVRNRERLERRIVLAGAANDSSVAARTPAPLRVTTVAGKGTLVGIAVGANREPLAHADISIEPAGIAAFADVDGRFQFAGIPAGAASVRARRLGFTPATVSVTIAPGGTDTVRVTLERVALRLDKIRASASICPNTQARVDTAVVAILQQVRLNAERNRLLVTEYPFENVVQRLIGSAHAESYSEAVSSIRVRIDTARVDTITMSGDPSWRYAPGKLVVPDNSAGSLGIDKMMIPQLMDYADDAFQAAHCFRYAGLKTFEGQRMLRVDFEPVRGLVEPDVRGSLFLDPRTYEIRRSSLYLERPSTVVRGDIWETRVETWFREVAPSLSVIDRISQRTSARSTVPGRRSDADAIEEQRLLSVHFLRRQPGAQP